MSRNAPRRRSRRVLMVGSEALPFAKTGGLADVLGSLPAALARCGWQVTVALPKYRGIDAGTLVDRRVVTVGDFTADVDFFEARVDDGVTALLIDCPELYGREALYGIGHTDYPDNPRRFALLARASLDYAARAPEPPSVVHAHDWQGGLVPVYMQSIPALAGARKVFTIHNMAYQGLCGPEWLPRLGLPSGLFTVEQLEYWGQISFLKAGIVNADVVTTVSPTYAREIQTPEFGFGFDGILRLYSDRLVGILNGIDTRLWDPATDPYLPKPFDASDLSGKVAAKAALLALYGLENDDEALRRPLIGMISRMVDQKGLDLIAAIADRLPELGASFTILGTGDPRYQEMWRRLARTHPDRIGAMIGFDEGRAHLIEAGADIFLMPSHFEPCGLNQMYSLRYGTVPLVRAVGGLADTVRDDAPRRRAATGFVFEEYTPAALLATLGRALKVYEDRGRWHALQVAGMQQDHSWDRSAREYVKIYSAAWGKTRSGHAT